MSEWMVFPSTRMTQPLHLTSMGLVKDQSRRITHIFVFFEVSP
jgi:hypothetical protein